MVSCSTWPFTLSTLLKYWWEEEFQLTVVWLASNFPQVSNSWNMPSLWDNMSLSSYHYDKMAKAAVERWIYACYVCKLCQSQYEQGYACTSLQWIISTISSKRAECVYPLKQFASFKKYIIHRNCRHWIFPKLDSFLHSWIVISGLLLWYYIFYSRATHYVSLYPFLCHNWYSQLGVIWIK